MDRILMEGMAFFGRHGVFPAERELGARFTIDVELFGDLAPAAGSDRLELTIDYAKAYELVKKVVEGEPCHLLEAVAQRIAERLPELPRVVEAADLPARVRDRSLAAILRLGQAESRIHGVPEQDVHLHELGGADTLVDLVGSFWLLDSIGAESLYCSPLPAPRGRN